MFVLVAVRTEMVITARRVGAGTIKMKLMAKALREVLLGKLLNGTGQGTEASSFLVR